MPKIWTTLNGEKRGWPKIKSDTVTSSEEKL